MNRNINIIMWTSIIIVAIIIGFITYRIVNRPEEKIGQNETTKNLVEISETSEITEEAVTDECLEEWDDYNEYMSERVEEASNNIAEESTHYLLKDMYGHIEVYYLDEDNNEYLYKKTGISTEYLSEEDIDDLQVGIEVVGIEALNKMLEDFE